MLEYLIQFAIIALFYYAGELLAAVLPLPVPGTVYGLLAMLAALWTGFVKLERVEKAADFLLSIMALLFIPAAIGILDLLPLLASSWWKIVIICIVTTVTTIAVTGHTAQGLLRYFERRKKS